MKHVEDFSHFAQSAMVVEDEGGYHILMLIGRDMPEQMVAAASELDCTLALDLSSNHYTHIGSGNWKPLPKLNGDEIFQSIAQAEAEHKRDPLSSTTFVHVHTHTEHSLLDGLSTTEELAKELLADGQYAIVGTDHGNCAVHPELQLVADKYGMVPIFGMEAYFVPDRHRRGRSWMELDGVEVDPEHLSQSELNRAKKVSDSREVLNEYLHLTLWAETQDGLRNLWAMSTESYRDGFYGKPRLDWDTLERLHEGVMCGTGCLRGPITQSILNGDLEKAEQELLRMHAIFGDGLYIEIHANHLDEQLVANKELVRLGRKYNIPLIAAVDSHYATCDHQNIHRTWLAIQTNSSVADDSTLFAGNQPYHLMTEAEVRAALAYLGDDVVEESVSNTVVLARRCTARIKPESSTPTYSKASPEHPDRVKRDTERLREMCEANWDRRVGKRIVSDEKEKEYRERFEREFDLLERKKFCGYFLIVADYVGWAKDNGCLVGPSRGSGGGSLVAYLCNITEIDPVECDLIFERFMTEGRTSLPDFDIDFPTSWSKRVEQYIIERWGEEYVAKIGTVIRLGAKSAINDIHRAVKDVLPYEIPFGELAMIRDTIDQANLSLAGKQISWPDFCIQHADLVDPMREKYPEFFDLVDVIVGRVKTTGKHAAGIVVSTETPLTDLPMRTSDEQDVMVSQFDMEALERLGYVKFDLLNLRTLDTLQMTIDLIKERYGHSVIPYDWTDEYEDPCVWDMLCEGRTLGVFQIETPSGAGIVNRMQPRSLADLADSVTLVRPGPKLSGLTDMYFRRKNGEEQVTYLDSRTESFLSETWGAMIYQEQILSTTMVLAGYTSDEADEVRKILGKKKVELVESAGAEFIPRAVSHGMTEENAKILWNQMAEFSKYSFGKAHAYAYAVLGHWCAWLKSNYPAEFFVACMSTISEDRIPDFVQEARILGYRTLPPDISLSKMGFTINGKDLLYGLEKIKGIGVKPVESIVKGQPYNSVEDFKERILGYKSGVNKGHFQTLVRAGAFDSLYPNRKALEMLVEWEKSEESTQCVHKIIGFRPEPPAPRQCGFDWATEIDPPMVSSGRGESKIWKPKPPPGMCSVKCRMYTPPKGIDPEEITPYTAVEYMNKEREYLGVWLTRTPFDLFDTEGLPAAENAKASDIERADPNTRWTGLCIVERVRAHTDKNGNKMAFLTLNMQDGLIDAVCFASTYESMKSALTQDSVGAVTLNKNERGCSVFQYLPILEGLTNGND